MQPGVRHRAAWSRRSDKYYYVISGAIEFVDSGQPQVLSAGDFCLVRQGEHFSYRSVSEKAARICLFHTPGFEFDSEVFE